MKKIFTLMAVAAMTLVASAQQTVWYATNEAPEAGAVLVDNDELSVATVYATTVANEEPENYVYGGYTFEYRINVRVDAAPTADVPTGTRGSGTPLVLTPKKNVKLTMVFRRQAVSEAFGAADGKDLKIVDQTNVKTNLPGTLEVIEPIEQDDEIKYGVVAETYILEAGKVYTAWAKGTTIGLFGFYFEETTETPGGGDDPNPPTPPTPGEDQAYLIRTDCPTNAIAFWYNATDAAEYTAPVGSFEAADGESVNYTNNGWQTIRVNGKNSNGNQDIEILPTQPLQAGDIIAVMAFRNKDSGAGASLFMGFSNGTSTVLGGENDGTGFNNVYGDQAAPNTLSYTVTEANAGAVNIYLTREKASTNVFIRAFQITTGQPVWGENGIGSVSVDNIDAPVYNVLGQPVDASYKGLVISNGKKYIRK